MTRFSGKRRQEQGFTLIEIMVVIIIIGILVAVAYPAYQDQVRKTRRAQARADLVETVQKLERFHSARNTYAGFATASISNNQTHYAISFSAAPAATTFTLQAVPQGNQTADKCGTLTINQAGAKSQAAGMTTADCW